MEERVKQLSMYTLAPTPKHKGGENHGRTPIE
jgi:hypothetical protein